MWNHKVFLGSIFSTYVGFDKLLYFVSVPFERLRCRQVNCELYYSFCSKCWWRLFWLIQRFLVNPRFYWSLDWQKHNLFVSDIYQVRRYNLVFRKATLVKSPSFEFDRLNLGFTRLRGFTVTYTYFGALYISLLQVKVLCSVPYYSDTMVIPRIIC